MARRNSTSLSQACSTNNFKSRQSVSALNLDSSTRSQNDILFDTLMNDPAKRAVILEMLSKEKDNIEKYKRREQQKKVVEQKRLKRMQRLLHCESPTALYRRKALENARRNSNSSSNSESLVQDTRCINPRKVTFDKLLNNITAYVEVYCNGKNRSGGIKKLMAAMGASTREHFTPDVTHVVYKDGTYETYNKAKMWKVHLVSVLWIEAIRTNGYKMPEKNYPALGTDLFDVNVSKICEDYTSVLNDEIRRSQVSSFLNKRDKIKGRRTALPMELEAIKNELPEPYTRLSEIVIPTSQDWEAVSVISYGNISDENNPSVTGSNRLGNSPSLTSDDDSDCGIINGECSKRDSMFPCLDVTSIEMSAIESPNPQVQPIIGQTCARKSKRGSVLHFQFDASTDRLLGSSDGTPSLNKNSKSESSTLDCEAMPSLRISSTSNETTEKSKDQPIDVSSIDSEEMPPLRISNTSNETSEKSKKQPSAVNSVDSEETPSLRISSTSNETSEKSKKQPSAVSSVDSEEMAPLRISSENESNSLRRSCRLSKTTSLENVGPKRTANDKIEKSAKKTRNSLVEKEELASRIANEDKAEKSRKQSRNSLETKKLSKTTGKSNLEKSRIKMDEINIRTSDEDDVENDVNSIGNSLVETTKVNFSANESKFEKPRKMTEKTTSGISDQADSRKRTRSSSAQSKKVTSGTTDEEKSGKKTIDSVSNETDQISSSGVTNEEKLEKKTKITSTSVNSMPSKKSKHGTEGLENSKTNKNNEQLSYTENSTHNKKQADKLISSDENFTDCESNLGENENKVEKTIRRRSQRILKEQNIDTVQQINQNSTNYVIRENTHTPRTPDSNLARKNNVISSCDTTPAKNKNNSLSKARKCNTEVTKRLKRLYNVNQSLDDLYKNFDWEQEKSPKISDAKTSKKVTIAPLCVTQTVNKLIEERRKNGKPKTNTSQLARKPLDAESSETGNKSKEDFVSEKLNKKKRKKKTRKEDTSKSKHLNTSRDEQKELADELLNKPSQKDEVIRPETNRRSTFEFIQEKIQNTQHKTQTRRKKTSIVCTRLHRPEVHTFTQAVTKLGGYFVENEVSPKTSHLVAAEPKRTINLLRALVRGCWILKHEWLFHSLEAGHWLPEEEYELIDFSPAVQQCRKERQAFGSLYSMDIFENCGPIFITRNSVPRTLHLQELVKLCRGTIVRDIHKAKIVVGEFTRLDDVTCVTERWILDSITQNKKKSFKHYRIRQ